MTVAGKIPMRSAHIGTRGDMKVACGRTALWGKPVHKTWPICKSCKRVLAAKGDRWSVFTQFDADGWSLPHQPYVLTTNSSNTFTVTTQTVWIHGSNAA